MDERSRDAIIRLAVEPFRNSTRGRPWRIVRDERFVVAFSPTPALTLVDGIRADGDVAAVVDEVREIVRADGRTVAIWFVGPLSEPADAGARLQEAGLVLAEGPAFEPRGTALVLEHEPDVDVPDGVSVRVVREQDEVRAAFEIQLRCNGVADDVLPEWLEPMVAQFDPSEGSLVLAEIDGAPVASASAVPTADGIWLTGAGTVPEARGRGAYRALVAARWREAVGAGTPALAVQAGTMSRPLLERMGFAPVGELAYYRDELA